MKFKILGCDSSMGVSRADGHYGNCDPKEKKILEQDVQHFFKQNKIFFDTSPDLRFQLLSNKIIYRFSFLFTYTC